MSEVALWRGVVNQAFLDATRRVVPSMTGTAVLERDQARFWLTESVRHFPEVCDMAELSPEAVRATAIDLRDRGWPYRAPKSAEF